MQDLIHNSHIFLNRLAGKPADRIDYWTARTVRTIAGMKPSPVLARMFQKKVPSSKILLTKKTGDLYGN
jgi:hypothetical protein